MLEVKDLCKRYESFYLDSVSFKLPKGYIMGFIGMNGAGKSTTLKSILNLVKKDSGEVKIFDKNMDNNEVELKQEIGIMLGAVDYYPNTRINKIVKVYKSFFKNWDEEAFEGYKARFSIDENKKISELSTGMKVKLGVSLALSHHAKLIILDEPTSGLDPIARDDILDLFREIVNDGEKSILFSTHITSDLDKCADFIIFIKNGKLVANATKDDLINSHRVVKGDNDDLVLVKDKLIGYKTNSFGFSGLMFLKDIPKNSKLKVELPNLEDIMIFYNKEDER